MSRHRRIKLLTQRVMKKFRFLIILCLFLGLQTVFSARAAEFVKPLKNEPNVSVSASETHKNLYVAGSNVTVDGNILGDLTVVGALVNVVGDVEKEVLAAGGTVLLNGRIGDNVRVAGGTVTVSGPIGGDLLLAAGNAVISKNAAIAGDLVVGAGNLNLDAPVKGSLKIAGQNLVINSKVEGNVEIYVSGRNGKQGSLVFGPNAEVLGKISYQGPEKAVIQDGAKIGNIEYQQISVNNGWKKQLATLVTAAFLIKLIAFVIAGLLLVRFKKNWLLGVFESAQTHPWSNLGIGLVGLLVVPIATIILFFSLIGFYLGIVLALSFALALVLANLTAALFAGYFIFRLLTKSKAADINWQAVVIGSALLLLVAFIPVLGWLVYLLLLLLVFGAILRILKSHFKATA